MKNQVRGVVNLCEEYPGPIDVYKKLGMRQLHLPTTDHFEPTVDDMATAVQFIAEHQAHGKRVYVHCRAGHGRSAAVVLAWLIHKQRPATMLDVATLNRELCHIRNVRKTLWKQRNMVRFHSRIRKEDEIRTDGMEDSE